MAFTSEFFIIDNIKASDIGVGGCVLIRTENEINRQFMGNKNIISEKIPYRDIPYFVRTEKSPIEFDLKFSLLDKEFDSDRLMEMGEIFAKDRFVSFSSCDFVGVQFFVICSSISLITYGSYAGWLNIHMITSAPYAFSSLETSPIFDCTAATPTSPITFTIDAKFNVTNAYGDYYYYPKILIDMQGSATSVMLTNNSDGGRQFGFTGLTAGESLEVENDLKIITSSTNNYRLSNLTNHSWFRLVRGRNIISCNNSALIQVQAMYGVYI